MGKSKNKNVATAHLPGDGENTVRSCSPLHKKKKDSNGKAFSRLLEKVGLKPVLNYSYLRPMRFRPAKLVKATSKGKPDWFVSYEYFDGEKWIPGRTRGDGMNRIKNLNEKKAFAEGLILLVNDILSASLTPDEIDRRLPKESNIEDPGEHIREMTIIEGIKWAFEKHAAGLAPKTITDYNSILTYLYKYIKAAGYQDLTVGQFKKAHLRRVMESLQVKEGISNKRYNAYIEYLKGIYKQFVRYDVFEISPLLEYEKLQETAAVPYAKLTDKERQVIYDHFLQANPDFLNYFLILYHTAVRPKELVALQISNYLQSKDGDYFEIREDETVILQGKVHDKTKTSVNRKIAIPPEAAGILRNMNLYAYDPDYYIFSKGFKPGVSNIDRKRATEIWNREVIKGLEINKKMYGLKHSGMSDKLEAGVSLDAVSKQAGHTNTKMSEKYTGESLEKIRGKEIREKSKNFLK